MNKTVLLLNAVILVVNLIVAMASSDMQVRLLGTTARMSGTRHTAFIDPSPASLRVIQSLNRYMPTDQLETLTPRHFEAIADAVQAYYVETRTGMMDLMVGSGGEGAVRQVEELGGQTRATISRRLGRAFRDHTVVERLTTEILSSVR